MNFSPFDRWLTASGIRHYTNPDGTTYALEVGLRTDGRGVHIASNPDEEDEANARLIAYSPQLVVALQKLLLSDEVAKVDPRSATRSDVESAWKVLNSIFDRAPSNTTPLPLDKK